MMSRQIASLAETLKSRAALQRDDLALKVEIPGLVGVSWEERYREVTYGELNRRAMAVALALVERGCDGPVLIAREMGFDWVASFFGCLYANRIAVPLPEPRKGKEGSHWRSVALDSGADTVLTSAAVRSYFVSGSGLDTIVVEELSDAEFSPIAINPSEVAFLQYTSGSTGNPKGVVVTHGNLDHNLAAIQERFGHDEKSRGVIWLPPYHDMGLIGGILQPIQTGFPVLLMAPASFIRSPFRWLEAVSRFRATTSGGPSFAYQSAARRVNDSQKAELDLSSWSMAFVGAEMVRVEALREFAAAFGDCGFDERAFSPCYGLAEATLMVSAPEKGSGWQIWDEHVLCGRAAKDTELLIVNPETEEHQTESEVGEILVSGPGVAQGYWGKKKASAEVFGKVIDGRSFLRTGDLGFLKNGELGVCGRLKDLIVIGGQNYLPADLEATAARAADIDLNGVVVFSVEDDGEEKVVLLYEIRRRKQGLRTEKIKFALLQEWALPLADCIAVKVPSLPRTSSGKLRRHACREAYQKDTLEKVVLVAEEVSRPSNPEELEAVLREHLARVLGGASEELDSTRGFFDLGLTSLTAMSLKVDLERRLGLNLSSTLIFDYPNPDALLAHLKMKLFPESLDEEVVELLFEQTAEPIAIISMACRFPGGISTPEEFWEFLREGRDAVGPVPKDRWDGAAYHDSGRSTPGKVVSDEGGFLDDVRSFDPAFFGIAPKEALTMDPQQRILLEVVWEALYRTDKDVKTRAGDPVGVFVGISGQDYARHLSRRAEVEIDPYVATGNAASVAAGRISYALGLTGPSISVDTSCSSSLVAVHLACQSLRSGECQMALAGGVNCILSPEVSIAFSQAGMLSPHGRCRAFSAKADGFSRAEGCGVIVLKRLSEAQAEGDKILATIRGSAINQDGRSGGLTVPHGPSQEAVIRQALARADATPQDLHYLEAHGTGTELGDPVELNALAEVFSSSRTSEDALMVGSVKTNLGHMEAAAGIGGLMKVVLSMQHGALPPHLHFDEPTPHVNWKKMPFKVNDTLSKWPLKGPSMAGVSSFGFSGTNAHVILERAGKATPARPGPEFKKREYWVEVEKTERVWSLPHPWLSEILPVARSQSHYLVVSPRLFSEKVWQEHRVLDSPVFPLVGYLELLFASLRLVVTSEKLILRDLRLKRVLSLSKAVPVQVILSDKQAEVVCQDSSGIWQTLCVATYDYASSEEMTWSDLQNPKACEPSSVYESLAQQGLTYGKAWQRIEKIKLGDNGRIEAILRAGLSGESYHFHPLILDAFVQTIAVVFLGNDISATYLPEGVGQATFHRERITGETVLVKGEVRSGEGWVSADLYLFDEDLNLLMSLKDFRLKPFAQGHIKDHVDDWFYQVAWRPEELATSPAEGKSPFVVAESLEEDCRSAINQPEIVCYLKELPELERLALTRVKGLLKEVDEAAIVPEQQKLFGHLKVCVEEADSELLGQNFEIVNLSAEAALVERCLTEIPAVLKGEQDPLDVLFPGGDASELTWLYEKSTAARLLNAQVLASISEIRESLGRPIRILEVGAGTGGTTSAVIPALGIGDQYLFTDVSPFLVEGARARFAEVPQMSFEVLDLEKKSLELEGFDLVLAANVLHATKDLEKSLAQVHRMLAPGGYMVLLEGIQPLLWLDLIFGLTKGWWGFDDAWRVDYPLLSEERWHKIFSAKEWESATVTEGGLPQAVFVARKLLLDDKLNLFSSISLAGGLEEGVKRLLREVQTNPARNFTVLTQGAMTDPEQAAIWGLARTIGLEYPNLNLRRIDLDPNFSADEQMEKVARELASKRGEAIRFRDGHREVARLEKVKIVSDLAKPEGENLELAISQEEKRELVIVAGDRAKPRPGEVEIRVGAAGLNFIDGLDLAGMLPFERGWLGVECAGEVVRVGSGVLDFKVGDRVMALAQRSFREFVTVPALMVSVWPENVTTAAEAATLPVNFLTVQRSLEVAAKLKPGEKILIHAGAGGTGMAAIQLAQKVGAVVFATASCGKWEALRSLGVEYLFDSRSLDFSDDIMAITEGAGVDVILNSLSGDYIEKGLSILSPGGRFIEIGKRGIWSAEQVAGRRADVTYQVIDLFAESETRLRDWQAEGRSERLFEDFPESVSPLPSTVFPYLQASRAFSYLQRAKHIGKVVLDFSENPNRLDPEASYLITGGAGGLGLETARWMIDQGARHIWLVSRRIPDQQDKKLEPLREALAQGWITFASADVSKPKELARVISQTKEAAPLRGVIHAAGVLKDGMVKGLSWDAMQEVLQSKAMGGWHLHQLTLDLPLDFFILYSSAASLLGSAGQGSHVAANAFLDALAHQRRALGLPAQSLNWGGWSQIGSAAGASTERELAKRGISMISPVQGIRALALAIQRPDLAQVGIIPADWEGLARAGLSRDPFFSEVMQGATAGQLLDKRVSVVDDGGGWLEEFNTLPIGQRENYLIRKIREELAEVIGLPEGALPSAEAGFFDLGVDSLMSVDLKNRLTRALGIEISPTMIFQHPNIKALSVKLIGILGTPKKKAAPTNLEKVEVSDSSIAEELAALEDLLD